MTQVRMYSLYIVQTLYNMVEMRSASKQEREREWYSCRETRILRMRRSCFDSDAQRSWLRLFIAEQRNVVTVRSGSETHFLRSKPTIWDKMRSAGLLKSGRL